MEQLIMDTAKFLEQTSKFQQDAKQCQWFLMTSFDQLEVVKI